MLACTSASILTGTARADERASAPADDATEARRLFDQGVALLAEKRDAEACPLFERSLATFPGNGTRGKLAECYERVGRVASAWRTYREVARVAAEAGDTVRYGIAEERAQALAPRLGHLVVVPPVEPPRSFVVERDGVAVTTFGEPVPTDAGVLTISASAPGYRTATVRVRVVDGQVTRFDVPRLQKEGAPPKRVDVVAAAPAPPPPRRAGAWRMPVAAGLAGGGVLAVGIGSVLALSAKGTYDDAFDGGHCDRVSRACDAAGQDATDRARSRATAGTVLFVAGAALAAGGVVLYLTSPRASRTFGRLPALHIVGTGATLSLPL